MKTAIRLLAVTVGLHAGQIAMAQAPAGSTGQCKDGTYTTAASKQGACHGHQGVKDWYAAAPAAPAAAATPAAAPAAPKTAAAPAAAPGPKPPNATGLCNDGTYARSTSKSAGCRGHQGVKEWYAAAPATAAAPAAAPAPVTAPGPMAAPTAASPKVATPTPGPVAAPTPKPSSPSAKAAAMPQAAGGGPGLVWVNTSSNVYHCPGSSYYGKTKEGAYMSEADAKAKGAHADHGKPCSQ